MIYQPNTAQLHEQINKGWRPNAILTTMSMAYFAEQGDFVAPTIFPICPVPTSTSHYYTFSKGDLARDNVKPKPAYGKVDPAIMGEESNTYACKVDQVIVGIDQLKTLDYSRGGVPGASDPRKAKVRFATEQLRMHLDLMFARRFFQAGVWANELTGTATGSGAKEFPKFSDGNSDPVGLVDDIKAEIKRNGRRKPNRIVMGVDVFNVLKKHPFIRESVKYTGSTANPALVNTNVLAQLFSVPQLRVIEGSYNAAPFGQPDDMRYICDSKSMLICYATDGPAIDEPSAGYIFTWDMLGNGNWMAMDQWPGESGTHSDFVEGLMSTDMKKTADDLACFLKDCV